MKLDKNSILELCRTLTDQATAFHLQINNVWVAFTGVEPQLAAGEQQDSFLRLKELLKSAGGELDRNLNMVREQLMEIANTIDVCSSIRF